jgi:hypothetical protein
METIEIFFVIAAIVGGTYILIDAILDRAGI